MVSIPALVKRIQDLNLYFSKCYEIETLPQPVIGPQVLKGVATEEILLVPRAIALL
jgi:hypothetical protein